MFKLYTTVLYFTGVILLFGTTQYTYTYTYTYTSDVKFTIYYDTFYGKCWEKIFSYCTYFPTSFLLLLTVKGAVSRDF